MIFLSITTAWTAALVYDRRQKKKIQRKWANVVKHIADETLPVNAMPRKLTVFVAAPPGDSLTMARDHFHEYVKPVLVSAALDWDAIEGRREGDVRAGLAERIRKLRKIMGEEGGESMEQDQEELVRQNRERSGVSDWSGVSGDIVIGRNTWKEYVRGLHEGWLGPLKDPHPVEEDVPVDFLATPAAQADSEEPTLKDKSEYQASMNDDASPTADPAGTEAKKPDESPNEKKDESSKPKKRKQPLPFNSTTDYSSAVPSSNLPSDIPSAVIPLPHILGLRHTPLRMYRFLNRRALADDIGRRTAAAVLATTVPYSEDFSPESASDSSTESESSRWEQAHLLEHEESAWHKSVRQPREDMKERVWLDDVVLDIRIAERMRKFELRAEDEERAERLMKQELPRWSTMWGAAEKPKYTSANSVDDA